MFEYALFFYLPTKEHLTMKRSPKFQAFLSTLVTPREGPCLNVMDATAHGLQAQHRNRYAHVSVAPMFIGALNRSKPFAQVPLNAY